MSERTSNPNDPGYKHYGGRGITVCDRWKSFENFLEDMGRKPTPKHSIDRIDNEQGYYKENCRWATRIEQARNTRRNRFLLHQGEERCIAEWAVVKGINVKTIIKRLQSGYTVEEALETPPKMCGGRVANLKKAIA